jgi:hypothetical protein
LRDRLDKAKTIEEIDAILDVCPMGAHELLDGLRSKRHAIWLKRLRATHDKNEILILYSLTENEQDKHYAIQKLAWFFEVK